MRAEKKFLVEEARNRMSESDFMYIVNFTGVKVSDAATFRKALSAVGAQYHVVKNSIVNIASKELNMPSFEEHLTGPTGVISGGNDPAAVAKAVVDFFKTRENSTVKVGYMGGKLLNKDEVEYLGSLPTMDELRAQFLSLLNTPASQMVRVMAMYVEKQEEGQTQE